MKFSIYSTSGKKYDFMNNGVIEINSIEELAKLVRDENICLEFSPYGVNKHNEFHVSIEAVDDYKY